MKSFKDQDILNEEEAIDKQMNDTNAVGLLKDKDVLVESSNAKVNQLTEQQHEKPLLNNKSDALKIQ